jgi:Flp pilus assembly protein TadG
MSNARSTMQQSERGATLLEFSIAAMVFFLALFGVLEVGRLLWVHNTLSEAVRQGARYAALHAPNEAQVKAVVVYGTAVPTAGAHPVAAGLTTDKVQVAYSSPFGVKVGTVTVTISGYAFQFAVPLIGNTLNLPAYKSTMTAESAGVVP